MGSTTKKPSKKKETAVERHARQKAKLTETSKEATPFVCVKSARQLAEEACKKKGFLAYDEKGVLMFAAKYDSKEREKIEKFFLDNFGKMEKRKVGGELVDVLAIPFSYGFGSGLKGKIFDTPLENTSKGDDD